MRLPGKSAAWMILAISLTTNDEIFAVEASGSFNSRWVRGVADNHGVCV